MTIPSPPEFLPSTDPDLAIGGPNDLLLVGNSFKRVYEFLHKGGPPDCVELPDDHTGFTYAAEILDSANVVLDTFTITPAVGDATGTVTLELLPAQVTTGLRTNAVRWQIRIISGSTVNKPLIYVAFTVT